MSFSKPGLTAGTKSLILCPIVGGLLLFTSFWIPVLTWVALVPLGLLLRFQGRRSTIYLGAYLGGLAFFLPGIQWLRYCDPSAWLGWLLLSAYLALYFPAFLLLARIWTRRWSMPLLLAMPIAWVAMEYARMHLFTGFGWLLLAHSLYQWTWVLQVADFSGVYGVSFIVAMVNATIIELLTTPLFVAEQGSASPGGVRQSGAPTFNPAVRWRLQLTGLVVVATLSYGSFRSWEMETRDGPRTILIQTSIPQSLKNKDPHETFREVLTLTAAVRDADVDLIVWPETSYPFLYGNVDERLSDREIDRLRLGESSPDVEPAAEKGAEIRENLVEGQKHLESIADELGTPLLVGTIRHEFKPGESNVYNASVLFMNRKGPVAHYDKIHLVPFGEYLPLKNVLPILRKLMPYEEGTEFGLDHAAQFRTVHHGPLNFAVLICFEDTLPHIARRLLIEAETQRRPTVDFFVNQSNDGWFKGSVEADYHLAASIFRCIEARLPMVRSANTGITALVDSYGTIREVFEKDGKIKNVRGHIEVTIPLDDRRAPYLEWGDWLPQWCLVVCALGIGLSVLRHARRINRRLFGSQANPAD